MIWTQNYFWYKGDGGGWLSFTVIYQVLANICPLFVFIFVVVQLISDPKDLAAADYATDEVP